MDPEEFKFLRYLLNKIVDDEDINDEWKKPFVQGMALVDMKLERSAKAIQHLRDSTEENRIYVVTDLCGNRDIVQQVFTDLDKAKEAVTASVESLGFIREMDNNLALIKSWTDESGDHLWFQLDDNSAVHLRMFRRKC
jgi:hypothetical protein